MNRLLNLAKRLMKPPPAVGTTPHDVVHAENKWRLLRYRGARTHATPVVLVPSLINRHYVLDLMPGKSFIEWMVGRGFDVYCVDWGTPGPEDRFLTFDDVCDRYIGRALRAATRTSEHDKAHVLGYCLGGTLATIHAAARPEHVASLVALAAPIRFRDDSLLSSWTSTGGFDVRTLVDAFGLVPWPLMQAAFHMLRPTLNLSKAVHVIDRAWDDEFLDGFFALEKWGNDNVSMPGEFYVRYIEELYQRDALAEGRFTLSGDPVRLEAITCPTLTITFEHDTIVPWRGAKELHDRIASESKQHLHLPGGHVGAVVSRAASRGLWPQIAAFWEKHDVKRAERAAPLSAKPSRGRVRMQEKRAHGMK
jgi:polyhydroxyalkanoate synthase